MLSQFIVQDKNFYADPQPRNEDGFTVHSDPRPYRIEFISTEYPGASLCQDILAQDTPCLLIDQRIEELFFLKTPLAVDYPVFRIQADEENKNIDKVLEIIDFLESTGATRTTMLYVVGGGILQDLGAFAAYLYKRGIPWTFVPTTLLAQGDSCVGGKTALNHKHTKNLLGLFSAPRRVIINTGFLATLSRHDILSGAGEIFRLCITGGPDFLKVFSTELPAFLAGDLKATSRLIATSLSAKQAVVEFDEFDIDIRRSMNYGHSFGHALEALSNFRISHGVAVTIGILVENEIAHRRGMLSSKERDMMLDLGRKIITDTTLKTFSDTSLDGVLSLLKRDKKAEGAILKVAALECIGHMRFIDLPLNASGESELRQAVDTVLSSL